MSLKKYKQEFIDELLAAERNVPEKSVIIVLANIFEEVAKTLNVNKVYIWADLDDANFVRTELRHSITGETQFVIYCFVSDQDAKRHPYFSARQYRVDSLDIFSTLLHFFTLDDLDKIICYNRKGKLNHSMAVDRHSLIEDFRRNCQLAGIVTKDVATPGHFGLA